MILTTTDYISGKEIEVLGMAKGSVVRTKNVGSDILASFKNLVGGEIPSYTKMMNEAREIATKRMMDEAKEVGADAIIAVRYTTSSVMNGASEIMAYGTAVKYVK